MLFVLKRLVETCEVDAGANINVSLVGYLYCKSWN